MSSAPLTLFAPTIDPVGVLAILREVGAVELEGSDADWRRATVRWKSGWFSRHQLRVGHEPSYYAPPDWRRQVAGLTNYLASLGADPDVLRAVGGLGFALSFPDASPPTNPSDPVHQVLRRIAAHLDAVFFVPGALLDREGRVLVAADRDRDPAAILPPPPPTTDGDDDDDDDDDVPPLPERVARRALCLAALTMRALAEIEAPPDKLPEVRRDARAWLEDVGAATELEPAERQFLGRDARPSDRDLMNAVWRIEGLAILGWALRLTELPRYDELVQPATLWEAFGVLRDPAIGRGLVADAALRDADELEALATRMLAVHWRLREFGLRPGAMDFAAFSQRAWFGAFSLEGLDLVDGDLALSGAAIHRAPAEALGRANSATTERHQAINWLVEGGSLYSEVDTST